MTISKPKLPLVSYCCKCGVRGAKTGSFLGVTIFLIVCVIVWMDAYLFMGTKPEVIFSNREIACFFVGVFGVALYGLIIGGILGVLIACVCRGWLFLRPERDRTDEACNESTGEQKRRTLNDGV